jgi:hypothetical protein
MSQKKILLPSHGPTTELPRQPDMERLYRRIRNLLRQYSARGFAETALKVIWREQRQPNRLERLRGIPWHILLLVKWSLQDRRVPLERKGSGDAPERFVYMLRQTLWTHAGAFNKGARNVHAMIRSYMGVQIEYQRHRHYSFLRWPALIAARPENSILRRQFRKVLGMEPATFIDLALALKGALTNSPQGMSPSYFDPIASTHAEGIAAIKRLFVRSLPQLREELANNSKRPDSTELLEFPFFVRYPILELEGRYLFWDEVVAEKAFERAVHLRMSSLQADYARQFSLAFEKYVLALLAEAGLPAIGDEEFVRLVGPSKNVEAIVPLADANLIVEAKMGLFADPMLLKGDPQFLFQKFAPLRTGMRQGHDVSNRIRAEKQAFGALAAAKEDFLMIVTSRDLLVSGGPMLKQLIEPQTDLEYFQADSSLPLKNTFIMDIQGFETFCMAVKEGRVDPLALLRSAAKQNEHVGRGSLFFEQWLTPSQHPEKLPQLILDAIDGAYERLAASLGAAPDRPNLNA